jgi:hypothetical protein
MIAGNRRYSVDALIPAAVELAKSQQADCNYRLHAVGSLYPPGRRLHGCRR